jgi:hypothetical protein
MDAAATVLLAPPLAASFQNAASQASSQRERVHKDAAGLAARVRTLALALRATAPGKDSGEEVEAGPGLPTFDAVVDGDFPALALSVALGGGKGWKREGEGWRNAGLGIALHEDRTGRLFLSSLPPPGPDQGSPTSVGLPPGILGEDRANLIVWLPDPLHRLRLRSGSAARFLADIELPIEGVLLEARLRAALAGSGAKNVATPSSTFDLVLSVHLSDADSARIYLPALRLGWAIAAPRFLRGGESSPRFARDGNLVVISGLAARADELVSLISSAAGVDASDQGAADRGNAAFGP